MIADSGIMRIEVMDKFCQRVRLLLEVVADVVSELAKDGCISELLCAGI